VRQANHHSAFFFFVHNTSNSQSPLFVCPQPQRSFFVPPEAKQKHTHSLLQKGFFRRAAVLSSVPFVNMYMYTPSATRFYARSDSQIHSLCVVCYLQTSRERERERSCTHPYGWKGNERTMMQNTLQALWYCRSG